MLQGFTKRRPRGSENGFGCGGRTSWERAASAYTPNTPPGVRAHADVCTRGLPLLFALGLFVKHLSPCNSPVLPRKSLEEYSTGAMRLSLRLDRGRKVLRSPPRGVEGAAVWILAGPTGLVAGFEPQLEASGRSLDRRVTLHRAEKCLGYETEGGYITRLLQDREGDTVLEACLPALSSHSTHP